MNLSNRAHLFFRSVTSGYAVLAANTIYSLASIPLALRFLQKEQFALWALATQVTGYLLLIDFGMSASVSRHLIQYKDNKASGAYGGMIQTGLLVLAAQGVLMFLGGLGIVVFGTPFLRIEPSLEHSFKMLLLAQCAVMSFGMPARVFSHVLEAHQRMDLVNRAQVGYFAMGFGILWFSFSRGFGVFSIVWANIFGWAFIVINNASACIRLKFLPFEAPGRPNVTHFRELFDFGRDVFWLALGTQMINASQTIVITRFIGLDAAARWTICTKTFTLAAQLVWRPYDYAYPAISEMIVRGERERVLRRFRDLLVLTISLSVLAATLFALCNQPFITIWTHGTISWSRRNDVLLAVWLVTLGFVHCHSGFVMITKQIGFMRYIYFIEGAAFLVLGSLAAALGGVSPMLIVSILCSTCFSGAYGIWRSAKYFALPFKEIAVTWIMPSARFALLLAPLAGAAYYFIHPFSFKTQFAVYVMFFAALGPLLLFRVGLHRSLRMEILARVPKPVRGLLCILLNQRIL